MADELWTVWANVESVSSALWKATEEEAKRFVDEQRHAGRDDVFAEHDNGTCYPLESGVDTP